jgi:branched-chain amino acid transport system ATP-binding protein
MSMLELKGLTAGYGRDPVLHDVNIALAKGEIVTLIGANGAGKSTLVGAISGLLRPIAGEVCYEGESIGELSTSQRLRLGICHVPEGRQIFAGMSVAENLRLGAFLNGSTDWLMRARKLFPSFPVLQQQLSTIAGNFSGGQQQMLAIARGLMSQPRILMLDEPSLGLSPLLVREIFRLIRSLREDGLTILLVEQNARQALQVADRGYVIENGRVVLSGSAADLIRSSAVSERYLGVGARKVNGAYETAQLAGRLSRCLAQ